MNLQWVVIDTEVDTIAKNIRTFLQWNLVKCMHIRVFSVVGFIFCLQSILDCYLAWRSALKALSRQFACCVLQSFFFWTLDKSIWKAFTLSDWYVAIQQEEHTHCNEEDSDTHTRTHNTPKIMHLVFYTKIHKKVEIITSSEKYFSYLRSLASQLSKPVGGEWAYLFTSWPLAQITSCSPLFAAWSEKWLTKK